MGDWACGRADCQQCVPCFNGTHCTYLGTVLGVEQHGCVLPPPDAGATDGAATD
jgi:hypothetical protein